MLLSHDRHSDNLDHAARDFLAEAQRVLTTEIGAKRLAVHRRDGGSAVAMGVGWFA